MSIKIIESENGFNYNGKDYKFGETLVEYANSDFLALHNLITYKTPIPTTTLKKFFEDCLFEITYNSIHYNLLKNTLYNYYDNFVDWTNSTEIETEIGITFNFLMPLFKYQRKTKTILEILDDNKCRNLTNSQKLFVLYKKDKDILDFSEKSMGTPLDTFEELSHSRILFDQDKNINLEYYFSTIQEFCFYELKKVIENDLRIAHCPQCTKYFLKTHGNQKFCSDTCKIDFNEAHNNKFYDIYRKRYKSLNNKYHNPYYGSKDGFPSKELRDLYNQYKDLDDSDQKLLDEFQQKLKEIK